MKFFLMAGLLAFGASAQALDLEPGQRLAPVIALSTNKLQPKQLITIEYSRQCDEKVEKVLIDKQEMTGRNLVQVGLVVGKQSKPNGCQGSIKEKRSFQLASDAPVMLVKLENTPDLAFFTGVPVETTLTK